MYIVKLKSAGLDHRSIFYLAAAVSDFFIPREEMLEHKIQSSGDRLSLDLAPVPKM